MRILLPFACFIILASIVTTSCTNKKETSSHKPMCDTACFKDTLYFKGDAAAKPIVIINANNCLADTVVWSLGPNGDKKKQYLFDLTGGPIKLDPQFISCNFKKDEAAWLKFNDCNTGRGFLVRLSFKKGEGLSSLPGAFNSYDPKFAIEEGLVAYSDRGNIFVEEVATGKKAQMTFGKRIEIDYDAVHEMVDSIHATTNHIWSKVMVDGTWKVIEKDITLQ